ncbi:NAD-dependent epimerase/dehydratase family protein [Krasilnikovia sp. MM14-A1259]|uniref:NAD-dependent epimerase/dehydratase family protein n=1 Tax=Krasilnikovia sp. MM14-A1259 TaxID=3373539 RepID=UPI0037F61AF9
MSTLQAVAPAALPVLADEVSWQHPAADATGKCRGCRWHWPCPARRLAASVEALAGTLAGTSSKSAVAEGKVDGSGTTRSPSVAPVRLDQARVLVTGGAGFVGGHVVNELLSHTREVAVLDDFSAGTCDNLRQAQRRGLRSEAVFAADVRSDDVNRIFETWRPSIVVHLAAQSKVASSISDPVTDAAVNVTGTVNVLTAAVEHRVERVVVASSGGTIYGQAGLDGQPVSEDAKGTPSSPYGTSKAAADQYVRLFAELYGLRTTSLAFGNVYGPDTAGGLGSGVVASFISRILAGLPPRIHGDGQQTRDFVHVRDVAHAVGLACIYGPVCRLNVGSGVPTSLIQLLALVGRLAGTKPNAEFMPEARGEVRHIQLDTARARQLLGWRPHIDLPTGIRQVIHAARTNVTAP